MLWYSLEVPHLPLESVMSHQMFLWRNKKNINIFGLKKKKKKKTKQQKTSYQELWVYLPLESVISHQMH